MAVHVKCLLALRAFLSPSAAVVLGALLGQSNIKHHCNCSFLPFFLEQGLPCHTCLSCLHGTLALATEHVDVASQEAPLAGQSRGIV